MLLRILSKRLCECEATIMCISRMVPWGFMTFYVSQMTFYVSQKKPENAKKTHNSYGTYKNNITIHNTQ